MTISDSKFQRAADDLRTRVQLTPDSRALHEHAFALRAPLPQVDGVVQDFGVGRKGRNSAGVRPYWSVRKRLRSCALLVGLYFSQAALAGSLLLASLPPSGWWQMWAVVTFGEWPGVATCYPLLVSVEQFLGPAVLIVLSSVSLVLSAWKLWSEFTTPRI